MTTGIRTAYVSPVFSAESSTLVYLFADAYIPWQWVRFPDTKIPMPIPGGVGPMVGPGTVGLYFYVKGDGRGHASSASKVGDKYRLRSGVLIDIANDVNHEWVGDGTSSTSEVRHETSLTGSRVLKRISGKGNVSGHEPQVKRLSDSAVQVVLAINGAVPWYVAGPQPEINFKYDFTVSLNRGSGKIEYSVKAEHDGFPAHEVFIEANGNIQKRSYVPDWFYDPEETVAFPDETEAVSGGLALAGQYAYQKWSASGSV